MSSGLAYINSLSHVDAKALFYKCCASTVWATEMSARVPFSSEAELFKQAAQIWDKQELPQLMEAFSHHPKIGGNLATLREKYKSTKTWASQEQKGVQGASEEVLQALSSGNEAYEKKFGFVFLICATGKSADEMLKSLQARLPNTKEIEIQNAKAEQGKITKIRLEKALEENKT